MDLHGYVWHVAHPLRLRAQRPSVPMIAIVRKSIRALSGPVSRFGFASCRSLVLAGLLSTCGFALADPAIQGSTAPGAHAAAANTSCPSVDFAGFLNAFSQSRVLQRRYTRFPLEFGLQDLSHLNDADEGFKKRTIYSFEKMPNYDPESGTVFPTPTRIEKFGQKTEILTMKNSKTPKEKNVFPEEIINDSASATVALTLPDSGVLVFYRFRKMQGCWFLYAISDRST